MIILEGGDGTGKSQAASILGQKFDLRVVHSPGYIENFFIAALNYHMMFPREVIVYDRFYYSELVYGPILRGESRVPEWFGFYVEEMLKKVKPLFIWCDVPNEVARENITKYEQLEGVSENLSDILGAYRELAYDPHKSPFLFKWAMKHDYTKKPLDLRAISHWVDNRINGLG